MKNLSGKNNIFEKLGRDFFLGCVAFIPLALFIILFYYLMLFIDSVGSTIFGFTHSRMSTVIIGIFLIIAIIYVGRKLRRQEMSILNMLEQFVIEKIPIIGGWYITVRDILQTFTARNGESSYLGTARVKAGNGYMIGFVTSREVAKNGETMVTVFVPTSPNPTTGLVFFFHESDVELIDLTPEDAFKKIISLGVK